MVSVLLSPQDFVDAYTQIGNMLYIVDRFIRASNVVSSRVRNVRPPKQSCSNRQYMASKFPFRQLKTTELEDSPLVKHLTVNAVNAVNAVNGDILQLDVMIGQYNGFTGKEILQTASEINLPKWCTGLW